MGDDADAVLMPSVSQCARPPEPLATVALGDWPVDENGTSAGISSPAESHGTRAGMSSSAVGAEGGKGTWRPCPAVALRFRAIR